MKTKLEQKKHLKALCNFFQQRIHEIENELEGMVGNKFVRPLIAKTLKLNKSLLTQHQVLLKEMKRY